MVDVVEGLGKTRLFGALGPDVRAQIAKQMRPLVYTSGKLIFSRGDPGTDLFLVTTGRIRLSVLSAEGRELSFGHPGPGDVFGEIATLDGGPRTANATAITRVETMALSRNALDTLMTANPTLAKALIAFMCARLRDADLQFESVALHRIEVRLARFFLGLVRQQHGEKPIAKPTVSFGLSQSELALHLGASRPKVNAALMLLEECQALTRDGDRFVCDCVELGRLAELE